MRTGVLAIVILSGCGLSSSDGLTVADLGSVSLHLGVNNDRLLGSFNAPGADCTVLSPDIQASIDGTRVAIRSGKQTDPVYGESECDPAALIATDISGLDHATDAVSELRLWDSTGEAHITVVGAFAPRKLAWVTPADGMLAAGAQAQLAWSPSIDTLGTPADKPEIMLEMFPPNSDSSTSEVLGVSVSGRPDGSTPFEYRWTSFAVSGTTLSFVVPNTLYQGPAYGALHVLATAPVTQCRGLGECSFTTGHNTSVSATFL